MLLLAAVAIALSLQGSYIGPAKFSNTESSETRDVREIPAYMLWSGGIGYKFNKNTRVNFAMTNLFNQDPPYPLTAGGAAGVLDISGRRYSVSVNHKFW